MEAPNDDSWKVIRKIDKGVLTWKAKASERKIKDSRIEWSK